MFSPEGNSGSGMSDVQGQIEELVEQASSMADGVHQVAKDLEFHIADSHQVHKRLEDHDSYVEAQLEKLAETVLGRKETTFDGETIRVGGLRELVEAHQNGGLKVHFPPRRE